ncbi:MAG: ATPase domain-containing protein [Verrucomicrobiota bacterium]|nr:ATPase domain-containing protein [Verrucomicrobiota bacterium]MDI9384790.1 ATPase domain-containing protein [Verrucomicrobiota bacterium]
MLDRQQTGLLPIDKTLDGFYQGRAYLLTGPKNCGKTTMAFHFLNAGLQKGEVCLHVTEENKENTLIRAEHAGFDLLPFLNDESLTILEYNPPSGIPFNPAEGFRSMGELIHRFDCQRLVLDPVTPWLTGTGLEHIPALVDNLIRALEQLGVTTLMTLPMPASRAAHQVRQAIEQRVIGSFELDVIEERDPEIPTRFEFRFRKVLALSPPFPIWPYRMSPEHGLLFEPREEMSEGLELRSPKDQHGSKIAERIPPLAKPKEGKEQCGLRMSQMPIFATGSDSPLKGIESKPAGGLFSSKLKEAPAQKAEKPEDSHSAGFKASGIRFSEFFFE